MLVKPDGVQRSLIGSIVSKVESKGLRIVGLKLMLILLKILIPQDHSELRVLANQRQCPRRRLYAMLYMMRLE